MLTIILITNLLVLAGVSVLIYKGLRTPLPASTIDDNKPKVEDMKTWEMTPQKGSVTILDQYHTDAIKRKRLRQIEGEEI